MEKEKTPIEDSVSEDSVIVPGSKRDPHRAYRIGKQTLIVLVYIGIGSFNEIIGPTLPDLKDRIGVNYEVISRALIARSIGGIAGALLGGFMHERYYRHSELIIACGLWIAAASTASIPFSKHLEVAGLLFTFSGLAEGMIDGGCNTIVMDLWREHAAAPMSSIHFGFGAGALLAPQIARPFLSPDARDANEEFTTAMSVTPDWNVTSPPLVESRIEFGYAIIACMVFVFGCIVFGVYMKGQPEDLEIRKPSSNWAEMVKPASCGHGHAFFAVELLILLFWYYIHVVGGEKAMGKFLFSFAVETEVGFTKKDASSLQTAFWGSFTAGRLLGIPLSRYLPIWAMMLVDILGAIAVSIVMSIYGYRNRLALWLTACFTAFFMSIAYPNGMSWANIYLDMNNVSVMILIIGGSCGGFIYEYLSGFLFEKDPKNLPYLLIGYSSCMLIGFIILQSLALVHGRRILHKYEGNKDLQIVVTKEEQIFKEGIVSEVYINSDCVISHDGKNHKNEDSSYL